MASSDGSNSAVCRITAAALGNDDALVMDAALAQIRAFDKYNMYRMVSRKAPVPGGGLSGSPGGKQQVLYGVNLGKGAVLVCTPAGLDEIGQAPAAAIGPANAAAGAAARVSIMHMFAFSRPGINVSELRGDKGTAQHMDWYDAKRPAADVRELAARLLGPLPEDLREAMLPPPTAADNMDPATASSYAFAAWLTGLPLRQVDAGPQAAGTEKAPLTGTATGTSSSSWLSSLLRLWNRALGTKPSGGGGGGAATAGVPAAAEAAPPEAASGSSASDDKGAPAPKRDLTAAEAWSEFERRVRERAVAVYGSSLEREWLAELGLIPTEATTAEAAAAGVTPASPS